MPRSWCFSSPTFCSGERIASSTPRSRDVLARDPSTCLLGVYSCLVGYPKAPCSPVFAGPILAFSSSAGPAVHQQAAPVSGFSSSFHSRKNRRPLHHQPSLVLMAGRPLHHQPSLVLMAGRPLPHQPSLVLMAGRPLHHQPSLVLMAGRPLQYQPSLVDRKSVV